MSFTPPAVFNQDDYDHNLELMRDHLQRRYSDPATRQLPSTLEALSDEIAEYRLSLERTTAALAADPDPETFPRRIIDQTLAWIHATRELATTVALEQAVAGAAAVLPAAQSAADTDVSLAPAARPKLRQVRS